LTVSNRLVKIARGIGVGEAYRAGEIAAVGEVYVGEPVWLVCRLHRPQSSGQLVASVTIVFEAAVVAEGPLFHLQIQRASGR
jgi:hypothetical protein